MYGQSHFFSVNEVQPNDLGFPMMMYELMNNGNKYSENSNPFQPSPFLFQKSRYRVLDRCVDFHIQKKGDGEVWPRLTWKKIKYPWLKIDFDKVAYEDESESDDQVPVCACSLQIFSLYFYLL